MFDRNNQYRVNDNNYFTTNKREKARYIGFPTKAVTIGVRKKAGYNGQNNNWGSKLLPVKLYRYGIYAYQKVWVW